MRNYLLLSFVSLFFQTISFCQTSKKPLDHSVYDGWQSISSEAISNNGRWIVYSVTPQEGDAQLVITNRENGAVLKIPRAKDASFTANSNYTVFLIPPPFHQMRAARIKKLKADEMPKDSLGIVENATFKIRKYANVRSFLLPEKGSKAVAIKMYGKSDTTRKKARSKNSESSDLILLNLASGVEKRFPAVTDFSFNRTGDLLAFVSKTPAKDSTAAAEVTVYDFSKNSLTQVSKGRKTYSHLAFDEAGVQLAFVGTNEVPVTEQKFSYLYYYRTGKDSASVIADRSSRGMREGWGVSADGEVRFSKNGKRLFFGAAPVSSPRDTSIVDFEVAQLDIWNYKDDYLQPMQLKKLEKDLKKSYMAVINPLEPSEVIQLADPAIPEIILADKGDGDYAVASTDFGHRIETQWSGAGVRDIYLLSLKDGSRKKIAGNIKGRGILSPLGNYLIWFDRKDRLWYSYDVKKARTLALNRYLKEAFYDEDNDVPDDPSAYGFSAFLEGDKAVLLYDRYDIWKFALDKQEAQNMTKGYGRKNRIILRYFSLDKSNEERRDENDITVVKPGQLLFLDAFNQDTKEGGWFKMVLGSTKAPQLLTMGRVSYSRPYMAGRAPYLIYRKENYEMPPDLYVSAGFKGEQKLSAINAQQKNYNWGTAELVKWTTPKGHLSEGILYKPENFDPARKYPMIVYFYEKLSDKLFSYVPPAPTPSRLNISYFVSNGYLVFTPDISYETGHPGRSAEEYINSGVEALKKNSWVDGDKIGIQGQSWGGYQVAHLITRTHMYAAAWAGAPVVNMFSAYGGIRWETGMSRQFQYEKTQSRIGATIWEKPELFVENSPLFHLPNVETPVVIMANDADGAVPWYQGIEMFTALRRLNKPVWMLSYNNEAHNLVQRQNRKDIQHREQQFFDHFLKGAPAPVWMEKGVPAVEKGKNWGFDLVTSPGQSL